MQGCPGQGDGLQPNRFLSRNDRVSEQRAGEGCDDQIAEYNKQKDICNPDQDLVISLPLYNIPGLNTEKRQDQIGKKISSLQSPQIPLHPPQEKDLPIPMNIPCSGKDSIAELL